MNEAMTFGDLVTPLQLIEIRQRSRKLGIKPDEECLKVMKCKTEDLSITGASTFIAHLKELKKAA